MRRFRLLLAVASLIATSVGAGPGVAVGARAENVFSPRQLIVSLVPGPHASWRSSRQDLGRGSLNRLASRFNVTAVRRVFPKVRRDDPIAIRYGIPDTVLLRVPRGTDLRAMRAAFSANRFVRFAELNQRVQALEVPDDPRFPQQWALHHRNNKDIDAPQAWDRERGDPRVMIAVIDTGVDHTHPDLVAGRVRTDIDWDFANDDDDALDDHGHGTHVTGILGADTANGVGVAGVCRECTILPVKVLSLDGSGSADDVAEGIIYAADQGARVINLSLGLPAACGCSATIAQAINYAHAKGSLLIAAAGNDGIDTLSYPARSPRVMAIGATTRSGSRATWSSYGKELDVVAPGADILSTWIEAGYRVASGTSMAAPFASGVAGLVLSRAPKRRNVQVWRILRHSSVDIPPAGRDSKTGFGRVNARKATRLTRVGAVKARRDECATEPSCIDCSAETAVGGDHSALGAMHALREVLERSERGRHLVGVFYRHTLEVAGIFVLDQALRRRARSLSRRFLPHVRRAAALTHAGGVLTHADVRALDRFQRALIERASPGLASDLAREWSGLALDRYIGQHAGSILQSITR